MPILVCILSIVVQCERLQFDKPYGKSHEPAECHLRYTLPSLRHLQSLLSKEPNKTIKNRQKIMRCLKVQSLSLIRVASFTIMVYDNVFAIVLITPLCQFDNWHNQIGTSLVCKNTLP